MASLRKISEEKNICIIAKIHTDFPDKFGIPRQSGLVPQLRGEIVFEPEFRRPEALIGIEEFSHLWLLWEFSEAKRENWSATVYPPRLGGKEKRGVFATRSPFRPNSIGLSCVKLEEVVWEGEDAPKLIVSGVDLLDGTPIFDIKPYLPYADAHPEAEGGFGQVHKEDGIAVNFPQELLERLPEEKRQAALAVLAQDPRAAYNKQPDYVYGMAFAGYDIRFRVEDQLLTVCDVLHRTDGLENVK
ncbi:MAG: tRNA (N6-threonylcarbamoyladenosine(37)-N6)-methyltransferase TrmO [Lachnospiraceae bacterium]|nr:tRNA (N6-threonylcarbamoyladenosine(37)-N6)-methyltransferase TrmO [Lachnospiraceae bacterium]